MRKSKFYMENLVKIPNDTVATWDHIEGMENANNTIITDVY